MPNTGCKRVAPFLALVTVFFTLTPSADAAFARRKPITIDNTGVAGPLDLNNFPVLVSLVDTDLRTTPAGDVTSASGHDIIFRGEDATTCGGPATCTLAHEIESYDGSTGTLVAWVRVPVLQTSVNTVIYVYYGDPAVTCPQENAAGVWDTSYREVFHLNEAGDYTDSTANGFTAVTKGSVNQNVAGKIGPAAEFNGPAESRLIASDGTLPADSSFTLEAWVRFDTLSAPNFWGLVTKGRDDPGPIYDWVGLFMTDVNRITFGWPCCPPGNVDGSVLSTATWYYLVATFDPITGVRTLYLNGALDATDTIAGPPFYQDIPEYTRIGDDSNGFYLDGRIDEVRISSSARSPDWIQTTYNNHDSPATFYTLGPEDASPPVVTVTCPTLQAPCQGIGGGTCNLRSIGTAGPYATGTITVTSGSVVVDGAGTAWRTANRGHGDRITILGVDYTILSVDSETRLRLTSPYGGANASGLGYTIVRKFADLQSWESCVDGGSPPACENAPTGSLVADNRAEIGIVYNDGLAYSYAAVGNTILSINNSITDATHDITLTAAPGNRHYGIAGSGVILENGVNSTRAIAVQDDHVTIEWLEIINGATLGAHGIEVLNLSAGQNHVVVRNNLIHNVSGRGIHLSSADALLDIETNIIYDAAREPISITSTLAPGAAVRVLNNTLYSTTAGGGPSSVSATNPYLTFRNNVILDTSPGFNINWINVGSSNNLSEDTAPLTGPFIPDYGHSPRGGGIWGATVPSLNFVSTTGGSENLHIQTGSAAENLAADLSALFGHDIDGAPRQTAWDIGADDIAPGTKYRSIGTAADYSAGTVTTTFGSPVVMGVGTAFLTANRGRGDWINIVGVEYTILSVDSETQLTLTAPFKESTGSGKMYIIGRQFPTLPAWEACISGVAGACRYFPVTTASLVADNRSEVGIAYKDSVFAGVEIDGAVTDASHTITLTADAGNRHYGIAGAGVIVDNGASSNAAVAAGDDFVTIEWLEIRGGGFDGEGIEVWAPIVTTPNQVVLRANLIHHTGGKGIEIIDGSPILDIYNNIIYAAGVVGPSGFGIEMGGGIGWVPGYQIRILNNTVYGNADWGIVSWTDPNTNITLRNNISHSNGGPDFSVSNLNAASSNNLSSDGSALTHGAPAYDTLLESGVDFVNTTPTFENLHIQTPGLAADNGADLSAIFTWDIDGGARSAPWDIGADDINATTAVELVSFQARGLDGAVELNWQTASELRNLGFHLYRATASEGLYERITSRPIPGLGSSPAGARYSYVDSGLAGGVTYYYQLEDIESTGKTKRHGPVSATPRGAGNPGVPESPDASRITYGNPSANRFEVRSLGDGQAVLELVTEGFYAEPLGDGSVRLSIPGFEPTNEAGRPAMPVKRPWLDAVSQRRVKLLSVEAIAVERIDGLWPAGVEVPELMASRDGVVRAGRAANRPRRPRRDSSDSLYPVEAARLMSEGFQGGVKKVQLELAPLRWDGARGQLLLARRLVVRLAFRGATEDRHPKHAARAVSVRLATRERGLHVVPFEAILSGGAGSFQSRRVRLSRGGKPVPYHLEPNSWWFGPGSRLYFVSEGEKANPYGAEAVYELEWGEGGVRMGVGSGAPSGPETAYYWERVEREENRYYQAGLIEAPDLWLWDVLLAPMTKSYSFAIQGLASTVENARLTLWLQGASDSVASPDHHLRIFVNGTLAGEASLEGKKPARVEVELPPGLLAEGENALDLENVGDTAAPYSMVMLDRFSVDYPRYLVAEAGHLEGGFTTSGAASVRNVGADARVLDVSEDPPVWLEGAQPLSDGVRFRAEAGRRYAVVGAASPRRPVIRPTTRASLRSPRNGADYVLLGPSEYLSEARPLRDLRASQGLRVRTVALEQVYEEFGFGEARPQAIRDFLEYAFHHWREPQPRYLLLLGDGTYDFKDYLGTGVVNRVPPLMIKTSYLWTASDPTLGAVNGDDPLPDVAVGRLPAANREELRAMIEKILALETGAGASGPFVLVTDNPDDGGDFVRNADEIAGGILRGREVTTLHLSQLGPGELRSRIAGAFDRGATLVSYIGHGGIHLWASENVFNTGDVASLSLQSEQPLVLTLNCLNGYFHFPYFNSLAEELLKAPGKGALAAFSPSGLSLDAPAHRFHQALLKELVNGRHARLGDAVAAAQGAYAASGAFPELLSIYHLFGDPALRLH